MDQDIYRGLLNIMAQQKVSYKSHYIFRVLIHTHIHMFICAKLQIKNTFNDLHVFQRRVKIIMNTFMSKPIKAGIKCSLQKKNAQKVQSPKQMNYTYGH